MSEWLVEMAGVDKAYPFFTLSDVSLTIEPGQIMGLIGPNGAGKSTTIRILLGLVRQDRGRVRALGHDIPADVAAAKADIGFMSEDMRLYAGSTVSWHMKLMASIYPQWNHAYAETLLRRFNLEAEQPVRVLSHGERTKATLLMVLARRPRLLVLDEPTTGLDPVARHEILAELMAAVADEDRAVLFSSQNTHDVEQISDAITFIDRGRVIDRNDKEGFLERWRRLLIELPAGVCLPELPELLEVSRSSRLAVATTSAFSPELVTAVTATGANVREVQRMTLEEIFVATVMASRTEEGPA